MIRHPKKMTILKLKSSFYLFSLELLKHYFDNVMQYFWKIQSHLFQVSAFYNVEMCFHNVEYYEPYVRTLLALINIHDLTKVPEC